MHSATPTGECRSWNAHASLLCTLLLTVFLLGGCGQEAVYLAVGTESGSAADETESAAASGSVDAAVGAEVGSAADDADALAEESGADYSEAEAFAAAGGTDSFEESGTEALSGADSGYVYVYVCGAVVSPGLYELEQGSRVYDAITAAGGLRDDASENYWNQAAYVSDGQMIDVPTEAEVEAGLADASSGSSAAGSETDPSYGTDASGSGSDGSSGTDSLEGNTAASSDSDADFGTSSDRININTATAEELMQIPGIGEARAAAIISYREQSGGFSVVDDIKNVSGIGDALFEKMKNYIEV